MRSKSSESGPGRFEAPVSVALALLALALLGVSIHSHSLTGDGGYHLLAGHQALRYGQNTVNLEHPPLAKLVMALPAWLSAEALAPPLRASEALPALDAAHANPERLWRATVHGRYLALVCWVLPFLLACYVLGRRFGGSRSGLFLVSMVAFSLAVLPSLTLLQTDVPLSLAFLLTVLAALRFREAPARRRALSMGLAFGLALAVKFSGVLLLPVVLYALVPTVVSKTWRHGLVYLGLVLVTALAVVELSYLAANRSYDAELGRQTIRDTCQNRGTLVVGDQMRAFEPALLSLERVDARAAQWLTGLLGVQVQNQRGIYPSYAFGKVSYEGRWWYFPALLLVKTPLALLLAALGAVALGSRQMARRPAGSGVLLVAGVVYLGMAFASNYNLGIRHLMPIMPLLYLPVATYWSQQRAGWLVIGVLALESVFLAPFWMSATNTWWLGEKNPTRFTFSAGNLEYKQSFKQLAKATERLGARPLCVLYPGIGETTLQASVPGARLVAPGAEIEAGWYAVSVLLEQYLPALENGDLAGTPIARLARRWRPLWRQVVERGEDRGYAAGTFHLYFLGETSGAEGGAP